MKKRVEANMDRLSLWSIPYMIVVLAAGEFSRQLIAPGLQVLQPDWPQWIINLTASLPGFIPMWIIGYWLFRRLDPSRRSRP